MWGTSRREILEMTSVQAFLLVYIWSKPSDWLIQRWAKEPNAYFWSLLRNYAANGNERLALWLIYELANDIILWKKGPTRIVCSKIISGQGPLWCISRTNIFNFCYFLWSYLLHRFLQPNQIQQTLHKTKSCNFSRTASESSIIALEWKQSHTYRSTCAQSLLQLIYTGWSLFSRLVCRTRGKTKTKACVHATSQG